ncbi:hypothetical protein A2866_05355 [Candidatus Roizmanbacteria bacterium RIFCSPHIGHO2_01_FULL_39_8]|uniref:DUF4012 domain-containing protein n=3 Tax=Candidatus Roizmaniibacteriota TaxID=1752723 RepID=A0A1F7GTZ8_9BACT|nr:MAG: hypothetical protein A2866_05355 [Candidatus Roizmanbacteria bacterium RIFCSPHIGHO2_01_FULL_39_8]OGK25548.1 MAG: hypothetical protein A3C28_01685 [Candidatus Roizmanbacteria bacterium RIFCSPHIGHO2_02_FULL_39_9]OGK35081.1 MAG: hypothetical protein A3F60_03285 [Candidatus Roizmanbacteria bacterium RIFCSPHIGHO2_12_FULL_39_8]
MRQFGFQSRKPAKLVLFVLLFLVIVLGAVGVYGFLTYKTLSGKAKVLVASAKELKQAFSQNDIDLVSNKLNTFSDQYKDFERSAQSVYWASFVPYVADFKNGVEAGDYLIQAGQESIKAISPYADLIGFKKGQVSFVEKSAEDRLETAILTLDKVLSKVDSISEDIRQAEMRIDRIDPKRYPEKIGSIFIRGRIENIQEQFKGLSSLFVDAKPLVKRLPEIFGKDGEKNYLILFQNDKELRATGGFLTAYAVFTVNDGRIQIKRSEDIYTLDASISQHPIAPKEILTYHKEVNSFFIRDSNLSPDVPTTVELFNSLYAKSSEKVNYDGIIMLDTKILVDMLTIFGDTEARGLRFSAETDKRCDCPQVIYTLLDEIDRPVGYIKENRKGILGDLMYALFYKAIGFSPSKYWGTLVQDMFKNLQEKHILVYFTDPDLQKSIEKLNFAGRVREYEGDYLYVNNVNFAGAKSNLFVTQSIDSKTKLNNNGKISREVTIEFRNPYPASDCNLERGGLCLNATLRDWIRFYVPEGSELVSFDGSKKKVQTYDELGKTVFEGYLEVTPQGKAQVVVSYTLPDSLSKKDYKLLIQKQPGTYSDKIKVDVDGKMIFDGVLDTDKETRL